MVDDTPLDLERDLCLLENHMATQWNNKIYVIGGNQWLRERYLGGAQFASTHMRVLDFTSSADISTTNIVSLQRLPDDLVPPIKWGNLFAHDGKLHMFGGEPEYSSIINEDWTIPSPEDTPPRPTINDTLFTYDIQNKKWSTTPSGLGDQNPGSTNFAYSAKNGIGWVYSGVYAAGGYHVNKTLVEGLKVRENLKNVIKFDLPKLSLEEEVVPINPVGLVESGTMSYLPSVGKEGILVVLGGRTESHVMRDMMKIHIFDISTKTWFTQDATAEAGNKPETRFRFCSVTASADDGSSHNIFVYGGESNSDATAALNDLYVLSIPAFHWIYLGESEIGKAKHTCQKIQEKYLVSYRGRGNLGSSSNDCDSNSGIQIYDLEKLEWTTKYEVTDTARTTKYSIPQRIYDIIGGDETGKANFTAPKSGWADNRLSTIFSTPQEKIPSSSSSSSSSSPPLEAILGGVLGGIALITAIFFLVVYIRRRIAKRKDPIFLSKKAAKARLLQEEYETSQAELPVEGATRVEMPSNILPVEMPSVMEQRVYVEMPSDVTSLRGSHDSSYDNGTKVLRK